MSTGRLFQTFGAATENARSDETSLDRGTTRSCLPAERREARPGTLATDVTNSVKKGMVMRFACLYDTPQFRTLQDIHHETFTVYNIHTF